MTNPIDIKTKKIIPSEKIVGFDKNLVLENLGRNILSNWNEWGKFQQTWTNRAYRTFRDLDKYIVMMYIVKVIGKIYQISLLFQHWMIFTSKIKS